MRKVKEIRRWIEAYESVESAVEEVKLSFDFYKEGIAEEGEVDQAYQVALSLIEDVELRNMLRREEDRLGAVLKVRWHREPRLGLDARTLIPALGRKPRLQSNHHQLARWR